MTQSSRSLAIPVHRHFAHWLTISTLSAMGLLLGWVPNVSLLPSATGMGQVAQAQTPNFSETDIRNYALSVLGIESRRQAAFDAIRQILPNQQVPSIRCDERSSLNGLPQQVRQIAVEYCTESLQVVEQNSLTLEQFNDITAAQQSNPTLADRIRDELIRIQSNR